MTEQYQANIGVTLLCVHRSITRGIDVTIQYSQAFSPNGFPDAQMREGFTSYVRSLVTYLDAHHMLEDELAFPALRNVIPNAPYELLMINHREMVLILKKMNAAIDEAEISPHPGRSLEQLNQITSELNELWHPHIHIEESHFSPEKLDDVLNAEEQAKLNVEFGQFSAQHSGPDYLIVPFSLYNMQPEDRAYMAAGMPPIIMQQLVPVVWKEKWQIMSPFLLT